MMIYSRQYSRSIMIRSRIIEKHGNGVGNIVKTSHLNVVMSTLRSSSESFTNPRRHTIMMNRIPIMISSLNPCDNRKRIMILMRMYELMFMANCDNMLIDDAIMLIERICNMLNDGYPMEFIHEAIIIEKEAIKSHE